MRKPPREALLALVALTPRAAICNAKMCHRILHLYVTLETQSCGHPGDQAHPARPALTNVTASPVVPHHAAPRPATLSPAPPRHAAPRSTDSLRTTRNALSHRSDHRFLGVNLILSLAAPQLNSQRPGGRLERLEGGGDRRWSPRRILPPPCSSAIKYFVILPRTLRDNFLKHIFHKQILFTFWWFWCISCKYSRRLNRVCIFEENS